MAARNITLKPADMVGEATQERLTGFDSHGQRYIRLALPRDGFAQYETDLNRWNVQRFKDGTILATPVRELIEVAPKVAKGAKTSA